MSVMEFILVAHAILIGLGIAELLRGFADLIRAQAVEISRRLVGIAILALLLFFVIWWAIWRVRDRDVWTFAEFILLLLPVVLLYLVARLAFPKEMDGANLKHYYERVSPAIWIIVACVYVSFGTVQPVLYGSIEPLLLASQLGIAALAVVATRVTTPWFQFALLAAIFAQTIWRSGVLVVTN